MQQQDERNAALRAAPASQHKAGTWVLSDVEIFAVIHKWNATSNSRYDLCRAIEAEVVARFRAEGGGTQPSEATP